MHLNAPGWNVIGGGEPSLPGVSIGHNDFGAWGLTIFGNDTEDLYVYDINPENPLLYKYNGGWESMNVIKESIPVKGASPAAVELKFTRHGPVVFEDEEHHKAYAVRAAWREVGSAPYLASLRIFKDMLLENRPTALARDRMLHWNYILDKDSVPAGIYEMFQRRLLENTRELLVPKSARNYVGVPRLSRIISWLQAPDGRFGPDPLAGRDRLLEKSLDEAVTELNKRFGPEMDKWELGSFHPANLLHPMNDALKPALREKFNVGNLPRGGVSYTVTATGGADNQSTGPSFKIAVDTENWDNSVGLNTPGQSGDLNSPHYRDLYALWARGKYFPIFYSRDKVESVTEKTLHLDPAGK